MPLDGAHILVQIVGLTEIGSSAYQLLQVKKEREEFETGGIVGLDGEEDEVDGARGMPKYPRGMLRFRLSDGRNEAEAIEYRSLPALELGETPLGYKMLLKNPIIRQGVLWLEPETVSLLGGLDEDRVVNQDRMFSAGLRERLGWVKISTLDFTTNTCSNSIAEPEPEPEPQQAPPPLAPQANLPPPQAPAHRERTPFAEISPPPSPTLDPHEDDIEAPRRRKIPAPASSVPPIPPSVATTSSTLVESSYFEEGSSSGLSANASVLARERFLSPTQTSSGLGMGTILVPSSPSPSPPPPAQRERPRERGRQIASLPRRSLVPTPEAPAAKTKDVDVSSDYDFPEDDMDEAALQALDRMEVEAASIRNHNSNPSSTPGPSRIIAPSSSANPPRSNPSLQPRDPDPDIIVLSDDEEEEDKENVPVLTRHVRPRTRGGGGGGMQVDDDVIDISD